MQSIPMWWLVITGLASLLLLILTTVLAFVAIKLWQKLGPLLDDTRRHVNDVGTKASAIGTSAKATADLVHTKTTAFLGETERASAEVLKKVGTASSILTTLAVAAKVASMWKSSQPKPAPKPAAKPAAAKSTAPRKEDAA